MPTTTDITHIIITDGACFGNPGPGGWAAIVQLAAGPQLIREEQLSGGLPATTNNVMELSAALAGLRHVFEAFPDPAVPVTVRSDSQYLTKGMNEWLANWKRRGWRTSQNGPVLNRELWDALDALREGRAVRWEWVRGHNGDPLNERADALANAAMEPFKAGLAA